MAGVLKIDEEISSRLIGHKGMSLSRTWYISADKAERHLNARLTVFKNYIYNIG